MASRVIHYLIAEKIAILQKLDLNRFITGALLPDLSKHDDGSYHRAHYGHEIDELGIKGINWHNFKSSYYERIKKDSLYMGYYCHLIMDALWLFSVADKYIRSYPYPERKYIYQKSYRDYMKLNYLLTKEYNLSYYLQEIDIPKINEIDLSMYDHFFKGLREDIMCPETAGTEQLELYPYDVIKEYITNAFDLCMAELQAFREDKEFIKPQVFYIHR